MKYLIELIDDNGHKLVRYDQTQDKKIYISVFDYSTQYGGTYDSQKYYNNYLVEVK